MIPTLDDPRADAKLDSVDLQLSMSERNRAQTMAANMKKKQDDSSSDATKKIR